MSNSGVKISVVTPTFRRPDEVLGLLDTLSAQSLIPCELVLVDGASVEETETEAVIVKVKDSLPFAMIFVRHGGGTAIQRNAGIDRASGDFIAFIDDDVRLDKHFFQTIVENFTADKLNKVGGIVGYRTNRHFRAQDSERWRWYRRFGLLTTYKPGTYDFETGYPINNNLQPPFNGVREVDFMTTACAVWRREVFESGLRFDPFFRDYGVLEDAHLSLRARKDWTLLQHGDAHCEELHSPNGRANRRKIGYKSIVNYYYVFQDIAKPLSLTNKFRFWRYQAVEFFRIGASAVRRRRWGDVQDIVGRIEGVGAVIRGVAKSSESGGNS